MTNYQIKNKLELPETKELPARRIDEKRKKRLAILKRVEHQRTVAYKRWIKKHTSLI